MSAPIWREHPNPGDMTLCRGCPHRRDDERKDYRCSLTRHQPYLPPLTELRHGKEHCGWWPPPAFEEDGQTSLFVAMEVTA